MQIQVGDLHPEPTVRHACIGHEGSSFRNQILQIPNTNLDSQASQRLLASSYRRRSRSRGHVSSWSIASTDRRSISWNSSGAHSHTR